MRDAFRRVRTFLSLAFRPGLARDLVAEGDALHAELVGIQAELALRPGA